MKYVVVTHVDAATKVPCTVSAMTTGPAMPALTGITHVFDDRSNWPLVEIDGVYTNPPRFYCTCDDTADTTLPGVLAVLTQAEFEAAQANEEANRVKRRLTQQVQKRLDAFAATRSYDSLLSACTYATSSVPQFAADAAYCVGARDATWAAMYAILAEVQAGTRPMPRVFADIVGDLPVLEWPASL